VKEPFLKFPITRLSAAVTASGKPDAVAGFAVAHKIAQENGC